MSELLDFNALNRFNASPRATICLRGNHIECGSWYSWVVSIFEKLGWVDAGQNKLNVTHKLLTYKVLSDYHQQIVSMALSSLRDSVKHINNEELDTYYLGGNTVERLKFIELEQDRLVTFKRLFAKVTDENTKRSLVKDFEHNWSVDNDIDEELIKIHYSVSQDKSALIQGAIHKEALEIYLDQEQDAAVRLEIINKLLTSFNLSLDELEALYDRVEHPLKMEILPRILDRNNHWATYYNQTESEELKQLIEDKLQREGSLNNLEEFFNQVADPATKNRIAETVKTRDNNLDCLERLVHQVHDLQIKRDIVTQILEKEQNLEVLDALFRNCEDTLKKQILEAITKLDGYDPVTYYNQVEYPLKEVIVDLALDKPEHIDRLYPLLNGEFKNLIINHIVSYQDRIQYYFHRVNVYELKSVLFAKLEPARKNENVDELIIDLKHKNDPQSLREVIRILKEKNEWNKLHGLLRESRGYNVVWIGSQIKIVEHYQEKKSLDPFKLNDYLDEYDLSYLDRKFSDPEVPEILRGLSGKQGTTLSVVGDQVTSGIVSTVYNGLTRISKWEVLAMGMGVVGVVMLGHLPYQAYQIARSDPASYLQDPNQTLTDHCTGSGYDQTPELCNFYYEPDYTNKVANLVYLAKIVQPALDIMPAVYAKMVRPALDSLPAMPQMGIGTYLIGAVAGFNSAYRSFRSLDQDQYIAEVKARIETHPEEDVFFDCE